jgi:predicted lipoprotein with Yx(FWY)xxD motif
MSFRSALTHPRRANMVRRGLAACGVAIGVIAVSPGAASAALGAWKFQSAPTLSPMKVDVLTNDHGTASGDIFLAPLKDFAVSTPLIGQPGPLILDNQGNPLWFHPIPISQQPLDFQTQTYQGKPVLTWWQGPLILPPASPAGVPEPGQGAFYVYDQHYKQIKKITGQNGFTADPHEFLITPQGTAIFPAVKDVTADLSAFPNGSATGQYEDNAIQEVDLKTGKLVFQWDMGTHVPLSQSQIGIPPVSGAVWDPYHVNSIALDSTGKHLLISARSTWGIYEVNHDSTGNIVWTLGGKDSTFTFGTNADFSYQHDARFVSNTEVSLFDDSCCNLPVGKPTRFARGLVLKLDPTAKTASLVSAYTHSPGLDVPTQGSFQLLSNGNVFLGWGQQPLYSEYTAKGKLLYDVRMPDANESYRTLRQPWVGLPQTKPSVVVRRAAGQVTLYTSWNGATSVASYKVLAGPGRKRLTTVKTVARRGFETVVRFRSNRAKFEVQALGTTGKLLATSALVKPTKPVSATASAGTSVKTKSTAKLGKVLATSSGLSLYLYGKDAKNKSNCSGACAKTWKPLLVSGKVSAVARSGVNSKLLGTIKRSDGKTQLVYNRHPLYTFAQDKKSGDLHGENADDFGAHWFLVNTKGNSVKPKAGGVGVCNPLCGGY